MKDDLQNLKRFVREHPDNKMGWYLLGRAYETQGKKGKALYCFTKAGEIYEAFEDKAAPSGPLPDARGRIANKTSGRKQSAIAGWFSKMKWNGYGQATVRGENVRKGKQLARALWALAILLFVLIYPVNSPGSIEPQGKPTEAAVSGNEGLETDGASKEEPRRVFYYRDQGSPDEWKEALQEILFPSASIGGYTVLAKAPMNGQWMMWPEKAPVLLSGEWDHGKGRLNVLYHDQAACQCTPSDPARAEAAVQAWKQEQEELAVLKSAIAGYKELTGKLPESPDLLAESYPNNYLPGLTPRMEKAFGTMLADYGKLSSSGAADGTGNREGYPNGAKGHILPSPLLEAPLEIVIDKNAHRLALVSGNTVVRSYPVGLGGGKTPEGTFRITERVKNPNGRSNGEFGSRGMTLSDSLYAIHGTNQPTSIGKDQSKGCIRMLKDDVEELYDLAPAGTKVTISKGGIPPVPEQAKTQFRLPAKSTETNPGKVYRWLD